VREKEAEQLSEVREAERRKEAERLKKSFLDTLDAMEIVAERMMRRDAEAAKQAEWHESEQRRRQVVGSSKGKCPPFFFFFFLGCRRQC
jgi:hypothetical protein